MALLYSFISCCVNSTHEQSPALYNHTSRHHHHGKRITVGPTSTASFIYYSIILNISGQTGCACGHEYFSPSSVLGGTCPLPMGKEGVHAVLSGALGHSRRTPTPVLHFAKKTYSVPSPSGLAYVRRRRRYEAVKPSLSRFQSDVVGGRERRSTNRFTWGCHDKTRGRTDSERN